MYTIYVVIFKGGIEKAHWTPMELKSGRHHATDTTRANELQWNLSPKELKEAAKARREDEERERQLADAKQEAFERGRLLGREEGAAGPDRRPGLRSARRAVSGPYD